MPTPDDFLSLFRQTHSKFSRLYTRTMARVDLSLPQYAVLMLLCSHDALSMTDISRQLHISKPAVTNLVDRLEKSGRLRRVPHPKDRRVSLLQVLPKGRKIVQEVQGETLGLCMKTAERLKSDEIAVMIRFHTLLGESIDRALAAPSKPVKP